MPDYSIVKSLCEELGITVAELMDGEMLIGVYVVGKSLAGR